jgi:UDP-N-acetyl-D-mannosaminuronic acid dehydrogenase
VTDVCVYGLGYIGLPTAAVLAASGHRVTGFDVDDDLIEALEDGESVPQATEFEDLLSAATESGALTVRDSPVSADYHVLCVPTPLESNRRRANLSHVRAAARSVATQLEPGATVILESTVPPGTTTDVVAAELETSGLVCGRDFQLAYCPETVLPGNILTEIRENDRIVGGVDAASTVAARRLYESFVEGTIYETDAVTAELVKLSQNTFRDVNIAFANELAKIAREHGVAPRELVRLANAHPRVDVHHPGPGVGGHCLPTDPWFLAQSAESTELVETARRINDAMPEYVAAVLEERLGPLAGRTIAILGIAYKGNVADTRQSPGLAIAESVRAAAADASESGAIADGDEVTVLLNDPHVADDDHDLTPLETALERADGLVVAADHDEYANLDPSDVDDGTVVVDAKGILDRERWAARRNEFEQI